MPIVDVRMHQRCIHTLDKILSKVKTYYESQDPSIKVSYSYNAVKQMGGGSYHYLRDGYVIFYMEVAAGDAMEIRRQTYALPLKSTNISYFIEEFSYVDSLIKDFCNMRCLQSIHIKNYLGVVETPMSMADFIRENLFPPNEKTSPPEITRR